MSIDNTMAYRMISHMLTSFVLPEIEKRIASSSIDTTSLPVQLKTFRLVQLDGESLVQVNDEVDVQINVRAKRNIKAGPLRVRDSGS